MSQTPNQQLRVLTISKPYVASAYRDKLITIAENHQMTMGLISPPRWGSALFEESCDPRRHLLWLKKCPIHFQGKNHFHYYQGLAKLIDEFRPDLINCEEEHYSLVTYQVVRLAKQKDIPCLFYTWQNIAKTYPLPFRMIEQFVFKHCQAGVCGNLDAAKIIQAKGFKGLTPVIPQMGIDAKLFKPASDQERIQAKANLNFPVTPFTLGYVGRLVREKGIEDLIQGIRTIDALSLVVLGSGPDSDRLRTLTTELDLGQRVQFVENLPSESVSTYMRAFDFLALPSRTMANWKEQFGRVLPEAMASGCIPIGSDSGEIPQVIANAGLIFGEGQVTDLEQKLNMLVNDPILRDTLRQRSLLRVKEHFDNQVIAAKFAATFAVVAHCHPHHI